MTLADLRDLARGHPVALGGFVLAAAVTLFFLTRFVVQAVYWAEPAHQHQPVAAWMTIGYVAKSWGLKAPEIDAMAGLPKPDHGHPYTLSEIATMRNLPVETIIAQVTATVDALLAAGGHD